MMTSQRQLLITNQYLSILWQQLFEIAEQQCTLNTFCQVMQNHVLETGTDISNIRKNFACCYT